LNKGSRVFNTVSFRLSMWYTLVFAMVTLAIFVLMYRSFIANVKQDISLELLSNIREFSELYAQRGPAALNREINREAQASGTKKEVFLLISNKGRILAHSDMKAWPDVRPQAILNIPAKDHDRPMTMKFGQRQAMICVHRITKDALLVVGYGLDGLGDLGRRYRDILGLWMMVLLGVGALLGWFITRRAMAGVTRVTRAANSIGTEGLDTRVPLGKEGLEVQNLAVAFNGMIQRIQKAVEELKRVTDDIAHDLRSPLTRMRLLAESAATGSNAECMDKAAGIVSEIDDMVVMISTMLEISQTESGAKGPEMQAVDIADIAHTAFELFEPVAQDKGVEMTFDPAPGPVILNGDRYMLQRVVANLLDNAIKFTPGGGSVRLKLENTDDTVSLVIRDTGIGIANQDIPRIFDRFFRSEHSRTTTGNGLGLAQAAAIIRAHKGRIHVTSTIGQGSEFVVELPCQNINVNPQKRLLFA